MRRNLTPPIRSLIVIWAAWFAILFAYQAVVTARLDLRRPDFAVVWTPGATLANSQAEQPYLLDPFMNRQVSWDSEYYISIALVGYDDPVVRSVPVPAPVRPSLNYAFFPLYPLLMRAFAFPLRLLGLSAIATVTLAGVIVALLGTLAGMVALWDMAREELGDDGGLRAAFYLLIFPTGFFLAMVYSEGLFVGIAFSALALSARKKWLWASLLAAIAPWVRAHGAILVLPLAVAWLQSIDWRSGWRDQLSPALVGQGLMALAPLVSYFIWRTGPLGQGWAITQDGLFSRGLLVWDQSIRQWTQSLQYAGTNPQASAYYGLELAALALGTVASLGVLRRYPAAALFSLGVIVLSAFSGVAQSMSRYVLVAPAITLALSRWGRSPTFDRAWSIISLLLMGLLALLFSFDMWVA